MIGRMSLKPSKLLKNKIYPLSTSSFSPSPSPPRLTLEHLWPLTVLVGVFSFTSTHPIRPQDFWWHIAIGRSILQTGAIPTVDTYSFTALGQPYASYQMFWLPETALYGLYTSGGPALVVFVYSLLITAAYALLLLLGWQITRNWRAATVSVLLAAAVGINDWNVRPQGITFLLGALLMMAIHWMRTTRRSWGVADSPAVPGDMGKQSWRFSLRSGSDRGVAPTRMLGLSAAAPAHPGPAPGGVEPGACYPGLSVQSARRWHL